MLFQLQGPADQAKKIEVGDLVELAPRRSNERPTSYKIVQLPEPLPTTKSIAVALIGSGTKNEIYVAIDELCNSPEPLLVKLPRKRGYVCQEHGRAAMPARDYEVRRQAILAYMGSRPRTASPENRPANVASRDDLNGEFNPSATLQTDLGRLASGDPALLVKIKTEDVTVDGGTLASDILGKKTWYAVPAHADLLRRWLEAEATQKRDEQKRDLEGDLDIDDVEPDEPDDEPANDLAEVVQAFVSNELEKVTAANDRATPVWKPQARGEQDDNDQEVVYPAQEKRAQELFEKIQERLGGATGLEEFDKFELRIQVPNLNTLYEQTVDRLEKYIRHHRKQPSRPNFFGRHVRVGVNEAGDEVEECLTRGLVQKNNKSRAQTEKRGKLMKDIGDNPKTLFLVVHDEAHYEATKGGAADMLINDEILRNAPNVVTLFVSATPYNLVTEDSQVPEANVVFWDTNGDNANPQAPRYFGLPHYEANLCDADFPQEQIPQGSLCACDAKFNATVDAEQHKLRAAGTFSGEGQKKNVAQAALLNTVISEYVGALNHVKEDGGGRSMFPTDGSVDVSNSLTNRMVRDLVNTPVEDGSGIMIMLRQPATTGRQIFNAVKDARNKLGLQGRFAVLMDLESKAQGGLRRCMETHNPEIYKAMLAAADDRDLPLDQYSDLESVPCILILCEKGKMGKLLVRTVNFAVLESTLTHACGL